MARVKDVFPGDIVEALGWDIALSRKHKASSHPTIAWLIPYGMNHKKAVMMGQKTVLFYVGPYHFEKPIGKTRIRKFHHFLTQSGDSVCLEGNEFRHLKLCTLA